LYSTSDIGEMWTFEKRVMWSCETLKIII
jgi:hypothetical protein